MVNHSRFSSLSESGFIPTRWFSDGTVNVFELGSHLFQRVASFLPIEIDGCTFPVVRTFSSLSESGFIPTQYSKNNNNRGFTKLVLISFREWLHSYTNFIDQLGDQELIVLISFREWLHSYRAIWYIWSKDKVHSSHLFQRVASFLQTTRHFGI